MPPMMHPFQYFWKQGEDGDGELYNDTMYVYWHPVDCILLVFDTFYSGKSVNGGNFYYNWLPNAENKGKRWEFTSSGGYEHPDGRSSDYKRVPPDVWDAAYENNELFWVGYHDCREALRFHIRRLREGGTFLNPWKFSPIVWLTHWADRKDDRDKSYDSSGYDDITLERFAKLPQKAQDALAAIPAEIESRRTRRNNT